MLLLLLLLFLSLLILSLVLSCNNNGYDTDGNEYSAVGEMSCEELVEIDVESVWPVTQGDHEYTTEGEYWEDELGGYVYNLGSKCLARK